MLLLTTFYVVFNQNPGQNLKVLAFSKISFNWFWNFLLCKALVDEYKIIQTMKK